MSRRWRSGATSAAETYLRRMQEILLVKYEDFLADRNRAIATIAQRLGLAARHDIRGSVDRQFQPRGSRMPYEHFFGERNLTRIVEACRGHADRLGYHVLD